MTPNNDNSNWYLSVLEESSGLSVEPHNREALTQAELKQLRDFLASIEQQAETECPLEDQEQES